MCVITAFYFSIIAPKKEPKKPRSDKVLPDADDEGTGDCSDKVNISGNSMTHVDFNSQNQGKYVCGCFLVKWCLCVVDVF